MKKNGRKSGTFLCVPNDIRCALLRCNRFYDGCIYLEIQNSAYSMIVAIKLIASTFLNSLWIGNIATDSVVKRMFLLLHLIFVILSFRVLWKCYQNSQIGCWDRWHRYKYKHKWKNGSSKVLKLFAIYIICMYNVWEMCVILNRILNYFLLFLKLFF